MKRSIISLLIFTVTIIGFATAEVIYSNSLAKYIDGVVEECSKTEDSEELYKYASKLKQEFDRRESINELFLTQKIIEKFTQEISDFVVYSENEDIVNCKRSVKRLSLYTDHLYYMGIF